MATSNIRMYKGVRIIPDQNYIVDQIEKYLSGYSFVESTGNFIRHQLSFSLVLDESQTGFLLSSAGARIYFRIINEGEEYPHYYFLSRWEQVSPSAIRATLRMDTLNTFEGKYTFSERTYIEREHVDRWKLNTDKKSITWPSSPSEWTDDDRPNNYLMDKRFLFPIYSKTDEGLNPVLRLKKDEVVTSPLSKDKPSRGFGLSYYTNESTGIPELRFLVDDLSLLATADNSTVYGTMDQLSGQNRNVSGFVKILSTPYECFSATITTATVGSETRNELVFDPIKYDVSLPETSDASSVVTVSRPSFSNYGGVTAISTDLSITPYNVETRSLFCNTTRLDGGALLRDAFLGDELNSVYADPKLRETPFSHYSFSFDSEVWLLDVEDYSIDPSAYGETATEGRIEVTYHQSIAVNSDLAFEFNVNGDFASYTPASLYGNWLISQRTLEEPLLSSEYLDYIRNGFNYDKKNAALSASLALAVGAIGAVVAPPGLKTAAAVAGTAVATGGSLASSAMKIDNKLKQSKMSAYAVADSNDLQLFQDYSGNKLHEQYWEMDEEDRSLVERLFYYHGYAAGYYGIPDLDSRYWFNFAQCEAVIEPNGWTIPTDYLDDIVTKYSQGVTRFHHSIYYTAAITARSGTWDDCRHWLIDENMAANYPHPLNWEKSILPEQPPED